MDSNEDRIVKAKAGLKVREADQSVLFDLLTKIVRLLGVPENQMGYIDTTCGFLNNEYGKFTVQEIELAFIFAIKGLYVSGKDQKPIDLSLYNKDFSSDYIGRVMQNYISFSHRLMKEVKPTEPKAPDESKKKTEEERNQWAFENMVKYVEQNKRLPFIWPFESAYQYAVTAKLIADTYDQQQLFKEKFKFELERERGVETSIGFQRTKTIASLTEKKFKEEYKARRIKLYLKEQYNLI